MRGILASPWRLGFDYFRLPHFARLRPFMQDSVEVGKCHDDKDTTQKPPKYAVSRHKRRKIIMIRILFVCHGNIRVFA